MSRDNYRRTFNDLKEDISNLLEEREKVEQKLQKIDGQLRKFCESVRAIGELSGADTEEIDAWSQPITSLQTGLTEAVRGALFLLRDRPPATAVELRDTIGNAKYLDLGKYGNALAAMYTVLGRMVTKGEVEQFSRGDGKRAFQITAKGEKEIKRYPRLKALT